VPRHLGVRVRLDVLVPEVAGWFVPSVFLPGAPSLIRLVSPGKMLRVNLGEPLGSEVEPLVRASNTPIPSRPPWDLSLLNVGFDQSPCIRSETVRYIVAAVKSRRNSFDKRKSSALSPNRIAPSLTRPVCRMPYVPATPLGSPSSTSIHPPLNFRQLQLRQFVIGEKINFDARFLLDLAVLIQRGAICAPLVIGSL
jgi:hypothetical protein